jgi:hypothetical protein
MSKLEHETGEHSGASPCSASLANDIARCNGVGFQEDDGWDWREGCETCLRRTAARGERVSFMEPPAIIAFECEFLISPNDKIHP